ncbi:MAG: hypothetical protein RIQ79_1794 [Verrucomicrobiota bacterium]
MRPLPALLAGLALGSGIAWTARHFTAPASAPLHAASNSALLATHYSLPATSPLVLPPLLVAEDADAALAAFLALPPLAKDAPAAEIEERLARLGPLLTILPNTHFERLLTALVSRPGKPNGEIRHLAFCIWIEHSTPAAARWAATLVPAKISYVRQAIDAWSRDDFAAAYAWSSTLPDAKLRRIISSQLLAELAAKDVPQALALAQAGDEAFAKAAKDFIFETWANRDPAAALQNLGTELAADGGRYWLVQQALCAWIGHDPKAALDWAIAQPVSEDPSHHSLFFHFIWQPSQKPGAVRPLMDLLASRDDIPDRSDTLRQLLGYWVRDDNAGALAWLDTVTDVAQRSDLIGQSLGSIALGKPDDFMALVQKLPASADRNQKIADHLSRWAKEDPDAAFDWLGKHDEPELAAARRTVEGTLIGDLARTDLNSALARWQVLPAGAARNEVSIQLAANWAKTDPAAATRWLAQQVPPSAQTGTTDARLRSRMQNVATAWARQDPLAYVAWTETFPDHAQRDDALNAFTHTYASNYDDSPDPPPRAAYASQLARITDPAVRNRVLGAHLSGWLRSDVQAARAWIESSDALSPEAAARLLTQAGANY